MEKEAGIVDSAAVGPQRPAPCVMYLLFITQPLFVFVFVYTCLSACLVLPAALYLIFLEFCMCTFLVFLCVLVFVFACACVPFFL